MTKKIYIFLFIILTCKSLYSQKIEEFNLNLESYDYRLMFPKDWMELGDFYLQADTLESYSGRYSIKIKSKKGGEFGSVLYKIPASLYQGNKIKLEGYIKTLEIKEGYAGLFLRIDDNNSILEMENMKTQNVSGTNNWRKYSIEIPFPSNAKNMYIGGILEGNGVAWFDNFILKIDNKEIQNIKPKEYEIKKASQDKEFDLNSNIKINNLDTYLISNLDLLGKIWGFLKYYHPEIGKGNLNWDYELFRIIPEYLDVKSNEKRNKILLDWINNIGDVELVKTPHQNTSIFFLKPDFSWFYNFNLSSSIIDKLQFIYNNRFAGDHYYYSKNFVGNAKFLNENIYYSMDYSDDGIKLLSLFRYWNVINYFYPYIYLTDKDWSNILAEFIPIFINAKSKLDYEIACIKLINSIDDTHATTNIGFNNVQKIRGKYYPPIKTEFIEDRLVITDFYNPELINNFELKIGDIIYKINDKPIKTILDSVSGYYPASNRVSRLRNISQDILRSSQDSIKIDIGTKVITLKLYKQNEINLRWYNWPGNASYKFIKEDIGYINLEFIKKQEIEDIKKSFINTKAIIIDIRNYPSEFVPFLLGDYFVSKPTDFVKFTEVNSITPGEFNISKKISIPKGDITYGGQLYVLVNEYSQSQSEYTAMAFRASDNCKIVGSQTAGADGNVSSIYLPGGLSTAFSGLGVYYPNGEETQRIGIVPDVVVQRTIHGVKNNIDEVLEATLKLINKN